MDGLKMLKMGSKKYIKSQNNVFPGGLLLPASIFRNNYRSQEYLNQAHNRDRRDKGNREVKTTTPLRPSPIYFEPLIVGNYCLMFNPLEAKKQRI